MQEFIQKKLAMSRPRAINFWLISRYLMRNGTAWTPLATYGHTLLAGYMGLRPRDPVTVAREESLTAVHGEKRMDEILSTNVHHVLVYPCLSVQPPLNSSERSALGCEQDAYRNLAFQTERSARRYL